MSKRRAFTLIELLIVISIIGILVAILLPSLKGSRKAARVLICMSNMRQMAIAQNNYANQYKDLIGTFNRKPAGTGTSWLAEAGLQAQEIVRRINGQTLPTVPNRYFHRNYWHLPAVADGAFGSDSGSLISSAVACPEDRVVLEWKAQSNNPAALLVGMESDGAPGYERYRPFWSSFQQVPCSWSPDKSKLPKYTVGQIITSHHLMTNGVGANQMPLGRRTLDEVRFPSSKVWMLDLYDRHYFKRMIWHGYGVARQPLVFFDGSVRAYKTKDARDGLVSPETAAGVAVTNIETAAQTLKEYNYTPATGWRQYDPPTLSGAGTDKVQGKYRWTFDGLKGYDYIGATSLSTN